MTTRAIVDYAENDQAKEMRDAFYSALQDKVMSHIEAQKMEVAKNMFSQQNEPMATADDEAITAQ
jgi:hypothetical protein